ncbi:MAG: hypothetical protein HYS13_22210 [Planctomycetia bacterium]|nr:hypothetical protein [Planctomycetia bacterium]
MPTKPILQALVLADHVYVDAHTGKKIIAGTFNRLSAAKLPDDFDRSTYVFVSLTEVHGRTPLELRYVDLATQDVLMQTNVTVESDDPLQTHEIVQEVPPFPMPHEGEYSFEVLWNGELLGSLRVHVQQVEPPGPVEENGEEEEE